MDKIKNYLPTGFKNAWGVEQIKYIKGQMYLITKEMVIRISKKEEGFYNVFIFKKEDPGVPISFLYKVKGRNVYSAITNEIETL